jgi:hypothetical protein
VRTNQYTGKYVTQDHRLPDLLKDQGSDTRNTEYKCQVDDKSGQVHVPKLVVAALLFDTDTELDG